MTYVLAAKRSGFRQPASLKQYAKRAAAWLADLDYPKNVVIVSMYQALLRASGIHGAAYTKPRNDVLRRVLQVEGLELDKPSLKFAAAIRPQPWFLDIQDAATSDGEIAAKIMYLILGNLGMPAAAEAFKNARKVAARGGLMPKKIVFPPPPTPKIAKGDHGGFGDLSEDEWEAEFDSFGRGLGRRDDAPSKPVVPKEQKITPPLVKRGSRVSVEYDGEGWDAVVLSKKGNKVRIKYDYDNSEEWVDLSRVLKLLDVPEEPNKPAPPAPHGSGLLDEKVLTPELRKKILESTDLGQKIIREWTPMHGVFVLYDPGLLQGRERHRPLRVKLSEDGPQYAWSNKSKSFFKTKKQLTPAPAEDGISKEDSDKFMEWLAGQKPKGRPHPEDYKVGDKIQFYLSDDDKWYNASITEFEDDGAWVRPDRGGSQEWVTFDRLADRDPAQKKPGRFKLTTTFVAGDQVTVQWDGALWPATVTSVKGKWVEVEWEDGSGHDWVAKSDVQRRVGEFEV